MATKEFALAAPPADGVAALCFSPAEPTTLAAASWDGRARVYDTAANALSAELAVSPAPLLDADATLLAASLPLVPPPSPSPPPHPPAEAAVDACFAAASISS